ncbi:MAG: acetylxylan esterase [Actinomycetaceae bacterium]|nr:acetylxylan esterase [Actinomycetaceae bacterium]
MAVTDLDLDELKVYRPSVQKPADFEEFWHTTIEQSRTRADWQPELTEVATPFETLDYYDLTFPGFNGDPIRAWLSGPTGFLSRTNLPVIITYQGYGGGRGRPGERPHWSAAGFVHLLMDSRGQGGDWGSGGDTPDPHPSSGHARGFMTNGIDDRDTYYYRRLITDAVRAIDAALTLDCVDPSRVFLAGASQGGGLAVMASALHYGVRAIASDVAFLCDYRRAIELTDDNPYREIRRYLSVFSARVEQTMHVLAYFDAVNFARINDTPGLFSVGLMDTTCPPSTTYGMFNEYRGSKEMTVYPYNGHEGGGFHQLMRQIDWFNSWGEDARTRGRGNRE